MYIMTRAAAMALPDTKSVTAERGHIVEINLRMTSKMALNQPEFFEEKPEERFAPQFSP
jgi:hypothetical protein